MLASIGLLLLEQPPGGGQMRLGEEPQLQLGSAGGGPAAGFCAWAASLGEPACLITRAQPGASAALAEVKARGVLVRAFDGDLEPSWLDGALLLHVPAEALFGDFAPVARRALEAARSAGAIVSVDLDTARPAGAEPARVAFETAKLRPEILFAGEEAAAGLAAPLEGLAKVPVLRLGARGCRIYGRRVPAPELGEVDGRGAAEAFAAAFCAAYVDGATPLEAAGRAVLVAAAAASRAGALP